MNKLTADFGYCSVNHEGEQLCGDRVEVLELPDGGIIAVLADGLGSGVKASILSTLTAKIISTMLAAGLRLKDCVETIAQTLPICKERGVAYSTFTILRLRPDERATIIQYENPEAILLRDGALVEYSSERVEMAGKTILRSELTLQEGDQLIAMSDGCLYAGTGQNLNLGWKRNDIIEFMETLQGVGFTAKTLATILVDKCDELYAGKPSDDVTALVMQVRRRKKVNVMIGPPEKPENDEAMLSRFFAEEGMHVICGGTTANIAAKWLGHELRTVETKKGDPEIPPMAVLEGADLVTEGIITLNRVVEYAKNYLEHNDSYVKWGYEKDGAATLARLLFEEATDIEFFIGRAVNPAHQKANGLPFSFDIKMRLLEDLMDCLRKMGKRVTSRSY